MEKIQNMDTDKMTRAEMAETINAMNQLIISLERREKLLSTNISNMKADKDSQIKALKLDTAEKVEKLRLEQQQSKTLTKLLEGAQEQIEDLQGDKKALMERSERKRGRTIDKMLIIDSMREAFFAGVTAGRAHGMGDISVTDKQLEDIFRDLLGNVK